MAAHSALLAAAVAIATATVLLPFPWTPPRDRFADMILANATIYTADPARPFTDAMAVRGGRVLRIGTYESVKLKGRHTHELSLSGNVVLPGFTDSHVHFIDGGLQVNPPTRKHTCRESFLDSNKKNAQARCIPIG
ncbi:unnamed protein product [Miscanthus lutarioriparius]|uniref:Amidohydrolase 3 domain-containing protein n=1 Tax=Miscanthus lutarioriparius TaxID=422564 RepID=A0A811RBJ6_9POAL|nr:unnamed protein product [Miscanthus lutarioriparius]